MNCRLVVAFLLFDRVYWTRGRGQRGSAAARQCGSVAVWPQCGSVAAEWLGPVVWGAVAGGAGAGGPGAVAGGAGCGGAGALEPCVWHRQIPLVLNFGIYSSQEGEEERKFQLNKTIPDFLC